MLNSPRISYAPDGMAIVGLTHLDRDLSTSDDRGALKQFGTMLSADAPPPNIMNHEPIAVVRPRWEFRPERISGLCAAG